MDATPRRGLKGRRLSAREDAALMGRRTSDSTPSKRRLFQFVAAVYSVSPLMCLALVAVCNERVGMPVGTLSPCLSVWRSVRMPVGVSGAAGYNDAGVHWWLRDEVVLAAAAARGQHSRGAPL